MKGFIVLPGANHQRWIIAVKKKFFFTMVVFHLKWRRKKITPSYRNTKFYPWWQSEQGRCCGHLSSLQAGVKGIELGEEYKWFPRVEISYVCCELINWWGWEGDNMELRSDNQGNSRQGITSCVEHGGVSILLWQFDDCIDVYTIFGETLGRSEGSVKLPRFRVE